LNRPWRDHDSDPSPQIGRKRRRSFSVDQDDDLSFTKKSRSLQTALPDPDETRESPTREITPSRRALETEEVKDVTKSVKEVDLDDIARPEDSEESTSVTTDAVSNESPDNAVDASQDAEIPKTRDDNQDRVESEPVSPLELQSTVEIPSATSADITETPLPATNNATPDDPTLVTAPKHAAIELTTVENHADD